MTIMIIFWRAHYALFTRVGRRPATSPDERIIKMAFEKLQGLVDEATAAAGRILAQAQSDATTAAAATEALATAEDQAVGIVQPLHDELLAASPAPAPETSADPAPVDPTASGTSTAQ